MPAQFTPNPDMYRELAHQDELRDYLLERATTGAGIMRTLVHTYGGPTWKRGVTRMGEFAGRSFAELRLTPSGWRSEYGSNAPWTLQVEYGTGKKKRRRRRVRNVSLFKKKVSLVKGGASASPAPGYHYVTTVVRARPQKGYNDKQRPIMRSLLALRRR